MAPMLLAFELGLHSAHSQGSQNLASHVGLTVETIRAPGNGAIFNHAGFRQCRTHREGMFGLTRNSKNIIVKSGPCTALREAPPEFKLWQ